MSNSRNKWFWTLADKDTEIKSNDQQSNGLLTFAISDGRWDYQDTQLEAAHLLCIAQTESCGNKEM